MALRMMILKRLPPDAGHICLGDVPGLLKSARESREHGLYVLRHCDDDQLVVTT